MKYEMQVWVTVSAATEHAAGKLIKAQLEQRNGSFQRSEVTYIDSEALKAETECGQCGIPTLFVENDYDSCPSCAAAEARADAKGGTR